MRVRMGQVLQGPAVGDADWRQVSAQVCWERASTDLHRRHWALCGLRRAGDSRSPLPSVFTSLRGSASYSLCTEEAHGVPRNEGRRGVESQIPAHHRELCLAQKQMCALDFKLRSLCASPPPLCVSSRRSQLPCHPPHPLDPAPLDRAPLRTVSVFTRPHPRTTGSRYHMHIHSCKGAGVVPVAGGHPCPSPVEWARAWAQGEWVHLVASGPVHADPCQP
jgi:hypothetical protein